MIRKIETDTASTHDSKHFDAVLDPANTCREVYADKGYSSAVRANFAMAMMVASYNLKRLVYLKRAGIEVF